MVNLEIKMQDYIICSNKLAKTASLTAENLRLYF